MIPTAQTTQTRLVRPAGVPIARQNKSVYGQFGINRESKDHTEPIHPFLSHPTSQSGSQTRPGLQFGNKSGTAQCGRQRSLPTDASLHSSKPRNCGTR